MDANFKFTMNTASYNKNSDGSIFSKRVLSKLLINNFLGVPADKALMNSTQPHAIVGDERFSLKQNISESVSKKELEPSKKNLLL